MAKVSGVDLRDFGTTFKAYRREILKDIRLYGELHRFIPALASMYGARIAEVPNHNVPRPAAGRTINGLGRTFPRAVRPDHAEVHPGLLDAADALLRQVGAAGTTVGGAILTYLALHKLSGREIMLEHGPLMLAGDCCCWPGSCCSAPGCWES